MTREIRQWHEVAIPMYSQKLTNEMLTTGYQKVMFTSLRREPKRKGKRPILVIWGRDYVKSWIENKFSELNEHELKSILCETFDLTIKYPITLKELETNFDGIQTSF